MSYCIDKCNCFTEEAKTADKILSHRLSLSLSVCRLMRQQILAYQMRVPLSFDAAYSLLIVLCFMYAVNSAALVWWC